MFRKIPKLVSKSSLFKTNKQNFHTSNFIFAEVEKVLSKEEKEALKASQITNNIAVLVHGCGFLDGTDVMEFSAAQMNISAKNLLLTYFSMDGNHEEVYDHITRNIEKNEVRNVIGESTRITRITPQSLKKTKSFTSYDFLVIPGGAGVLSVLTDYNENGLNFKINPDVERIMNTFLEFKKPIILTSHAAILAAKMFGNDVQIAVGNNDGIEDECKALGANCLTLQKPTHTVIDTKHNIITTPCNSVGLISPSQIYEALLNAVEDAQELIKDAQSGGKKDTDDSKLIEEIRIHLGEEEVQNFIRDVEEHKRKIEASKRKR